MSNPYFDIGIPVNMVAQLDAANLLKALESGTQYSLTLEQRQQALAAIERVQENSQASLLDVFNTFMLVPILEQFALTIKQVFLAN